MVEPLVACDFFRDFSITAGNGPMIGGELRCACGSGLRPVRCCQMEMAALSPPGAARALAPVIERAAELLRQNAIEEGRELCLEVLELSPGQLDALTMLYHICKVRGPASAVEALLRRIVQLHPNTFWAVNELALLLFGRGAILEALHHARNAVRIAPDNPQSHNLMGILMTEANRPQVGEYHYRKVIELSERRDPVTIANLAWNLKNQGRIDEARRLYEEAATVDANLHTLLGWARMEEADRHLDRAEELLDQAAVLVP
jgi:Flp pilus assembly protein TadD